MQSISLFSADPGVGRSVVMVVYVATVITWPGSTAAVSFPARSPNTSVGVCVLFRAELIPATAPLGPLYGATVPCLHDSGNCDQIRRTLVAAYRRARIVK